MENRKTVGFIGGKFLPLHLGHVYAIIEASNKVDELYVVLSSSKNRDKEICERDGIKHIPADVRMSWLGEALNNLENIKIIHIEDDQWDNNYDWEEGADKIKEAIGKPIDYVFSSEHDYDKYFNEYYPNSKHIVVDDKRKTVTTSATELRRNLYDNWERLPTCVREYFTKKVAIVGTESCGKTTLSKQLAKFYNIEQVSETGRIYCLRYANNLTRKMFDHIAMEHFLAQVKIAKDNNKMFIVDSDAVITQYYLGMYFNNSKSQLIEEIIKLQDYDLVLFLEPDVKWVSDGLRFAGAEEERKKNNEKMKKMYKERGIHFRSISGNYTERFNKARKLIDELFKK